LSTNLQIGDSLGRDAGPYSARNSSKGALIAESRLVLRALASGKSIEAVRDESLDGKLFRQAARDTRHRIWWSLHWRFFAWSPPQWVLTDLGAASHNEVTSPKFVGLIYLHFARRDRLTFDFMTDKLWALWKGGTQRVRRDDAIDFLADSLKGQPRWRESTRVKLAGNLLSALRDFGLLTGVRRKMLHRPVVAPEVVMHLCRLLDAEGLRGRSLLEARDWRLFLWDLQDTSRALGNLAQQGELRFERSGRTVMLDVPRHPIGDGR
jgi:hypothetical protein